MPIRHRIGRDAAGLGGAVLGGAVLGLIPAPTRRILKRMGSAGSRVQSVIETTLAVTLIL